MKKKINLTHLIASPRGGGIQHIQHLVRNLSSDNFDMTLMVPNPKKLPKKTLNLSKDSNLQILKTSYLAEPKPRNIKTFNEQITRGEHDILHFHGTRAATFGRLAVLIFGFSARMVYTIHGLHYLKSQAFLKRILLKNSDRLLHQITDHVICVSSTDQRNYSNLRLINEDNISLVPNGIAIDQFDKKISQQEKKHFYEQHEISPNKTILTMVARLDHPKDQKTLIEALKHLPNVSNYHLLLVGEGSKREELQQLCRKLGLSNYVDFVGYYNDIPKLLDLTDIFVLSTKWEGLPQSVLEAMASGTPVIATDVSGNNDLISHEYDGLLVPVEKSAELSNAIQRLQNNKNLRNIIAQNGLETIRQFSDEAMTSRTETIYRIIL